MSATLRRQRQWRGASALRYGSGMPRLCAAACAVSLLLCACTDDEVIVGSQCPSAPSGRATLAKDAGPALLYGTSCAPCAGDKVTLDVHGCPVLVTWASCGGDICVGHQLLPRPSLDGGPSADGGDAGGDASADAGGAGDASSDAGSHTDDDAGGTL